MHEVVHLGRSPLKISSDLEKAVVIVVLTPPTIPRQS